MCVRMRAIQSRAGPISKRDIDSDIDTAHLGYCGQKFKVQMCTACHMGMRAQFSSSSLVTPSYALLVASFRLAREQLALYSILGSIWPPDSLFNKFKRLSHRNEAHCSSSVDTVVSLKA